MYRVVIYCPDRHIQYDGRTPYRTGVGGGITSRVRMARALARAGNQVKMIVNCNSRQFIDKVEYVPLQIAQSIDTDVLILNSSGGVLDLSPILKLDVTATLRIIWVSGKSQPNGVENLEYDFIYAKSNFLRDHIKREWRTPTKKIFVAYNCYDEDLYESVAKESFFRDPFRLIYASHPIKGLNAAASILRELRKYDRRYHLSVYGGRGLWGQAENEIPFEPGLEYHGLVGQQRLTKELLRSTFSINLQAIEEGFGLVVLESMRAGCAVIASPVGAFRELIRDSVDGILIEGDHRSEKIQSLAANLILNLSRNSKECSVMQNKAQAVIWDSDTMAQTWMEHWNWWFEPTNERMIEEDEHDSCPHNEASLLQLADGHHCVGCGSYYRVEKLIA